MRPTCCESNLGQPENCFTCLKLKVCPRHPKGAWSCGVEIKICFWFDRNFLISTNIYTFVWVLFNARIWQERRRNQNGFRFVMFKWIGFWDRKNFSNPGVHNRLKLTLEKLTALSSLWLSEKNQQNPDALAWNIE